MSSVAAAKRLADGAAANLVLASANPVPDGLSRYRDLELIDGALIDNNVLFLLVREKMLTRRRSVNRHSLWLHAPQAGPKGPQSRRLQRGVTMPGNENGSTQ